MVWVMFKWVVWSLICCFDFFVEMYKIWGKWVVNWKVIWSNKVDLLMFGFLLIKINVFGIMFFFKIWFNFL